ncbi:sterol desaturase family protein [Nostoc sp.]|uniref:sterol desaturase family protein n=1 Tax=Nostoc sp. TaxID=1180 RepID=UPI002FFC4F80
MFSLSIETITNIFLDCALLGLALFAGWVAPKWKRVYLCLAIVGIALFFGRTVILYNWLMPCIMLLILLIEAPWSQSWYNWSTKEILETLGINACADLSTIVVVALAFGHLLRDFPLGTGNWGLVTIGVPLWLQVVVFLVLIDFQRYWFHRLDHSFIFLWRFHKIHHGISKFNVISSQRAHPNHRIGNTICYLGIAYLIGITKEAYVLTLGCSLIFDIYLAHSNLNFPRLNEKFPWFAYLIVTPNFHGWHHTVHCRYNANLADFFPFWDILFGTFEKPYGNRCDWRFGLQESEQLPSSVLGQLMSPFNNIEKLH